MFNKYISSLFCHRLRTKFKFDVPDLRFSSPEGRGKKEKGTSEDKYLNSQSPRPPVGGRGALNINNIISDFYNCREDMFNKKDIYVKEDTFNKSYPYSHYPQQSRPCRAFGSAGRSLCDWGKVSKGAEFIFFDFNLNKLNYDPNTIKDKYCK